MICTVTCYFVINNNCSNTNLYNELVAFSSKYTSSWSFQSYSIDNVRLHNVDTVLLSIIYSLK